MVSYSAPQDRSEQPAPVQQGFKRITTVDDYETRWMLVGPRGAVDFHCSHASDRYTFGRIGGIEEHHRTPPSYMREEQPSHEHCWILGGKCWHDGSSLYASEVLIPLLERDGEAAIWKQLDCEYRKRFGETEQAGGHDPVAPTKATDVPLTTPDRSSL